ncbi:MAG: hypothetical protein IJV45_05710 [Prevotella sp.]|nr:hypothetical protein [Prevotella sp.]
MASTSSGYTVSGNSLVMNTTNPMEFVLGVPATGKYSLKMSDGKMLGYSGSSTDFRNTKTNASETYEQWTIAYNSTYSMYTIVNVQSTGRHIGYSGSNKFAPYASMTSNAPATLYKKQAAITLTATSNDETLGTVSVTGAFITAIPKENCRVSKANPYEVTVGEATVEQNGNVFTVVASSDCTVKINFEAVPQHKANFYVNGQLDSSTDVYEDAAITFPDELADLGTFKFYGWTETAINGIQDEKPELVSEITMNESDMDFYAVFAEGTTTIGTKSYTLEYDKESNLSSSTNWGSYGKAFTYTATDGSQWVVKAYKNQGMQINTGRSSSIKVPSCPGNIQSIAITGTISKAVGFSASDYDGSGTITYLASGTDATSQTLDLSSQSVNTGYIVPKSGSITIKKIVVNYTSVVDDYKNYCTYVAPTTATISINSACTDGKENYYGTFYTDKAYVMHEYLEGQVVSVDEAGVLTVETAYEGGDVVPANTALLIYALEPGDYTVNFTSEEGDDWSYYNMLKGALTDDEMTVGENCLFYRLTMHNGTQLGFWWGAAEGAAFKPGANKAYLAAPIPVGGIRQSGLWVDSESSSIESLTKNATEVNAVYNIMGQRVVSSTKGLVIMNGKKYMNK